MNYTDTKYIAHRGNLVGPSAMENHPDQIREALNAGFDVEVDAWIVDNKLYFGHDAPQYEVSFDIITDRFWVHCKNFEALKWHSRTSHNCFWHDTDDYTLTSKNFLWTNIGKELHYNSVMVMPELSSGDWLTNTVNAKCYGICSDYIQKIKIARA